MKGDFTRVTHRPERGYSKVLLQQGRVTLDADWNEAADIHEAHEVATNTDVIGPTGAPKVGGGFEVLVADDGADLAVTPGQFYLDGLLCEAFATPVVATALAGAGVISVPAWKVDGLEYAVGQLLQARWGPAPEDRAFVKITGVTRDTHRITVTPILPTGAIPAGRVELRRLVRLSGQPFPRDPTGWITPVAGRVDLVYLDVWQRHVTFLEDSDIRDPALGGPDTATRVQTVWQLRILPDVGDPNCSATHAGWDAVTAGSTGRLTTREAPTQEPTDPCEPVEGGGFSGLENRLYRVEIHGPGGIGIGPSAATFKWSRDNGSIAFAVERFIDGEPSKLVLRRLGRDEVLTIHAGDWVEVLDDKVEFDGTVGFIARVKQVFEGDRMVELETGIPPGQFDIKRHARLRRWDQKQGVTDGGVVRARAGDIELEDGVLIRFSGSTFGSGDYWSFSARTATHKVDTLVESPARGPYHHFAKLATVVWAAAGAGWTGTLHDCRPEFPPLTDITASDVSFDDSHCSLAAETVQEALDELCYHVRALRYVGGDGQEGSPGAPLGAPLAAGVEDEHGQPISGAPVRFTIQPFGSITPGALREHGSAAAPGPVVTVNTDADGVAAVDWIMPPVDSPPGTYTVLSEFAGSLPQDQRGALVLDFHATMIPPKKVQQWPTVVAFDWVENQDREMPLDRFNRGLAVRFSMPMHSACARPEFFQVIVEEPIVSTDPAFKGHRPLLVSGVVTGFEGVPQKGFPGWRFVPQPSLTIEALRVWLKIEQAVSGVSRILCRVVLKGDAIVDATGEHRLDGDALARPSRLKADLDRNRVPRVLDLQLPSGDGVEGGDFESWFYLIPGTTVPSTTAEVVGTPVNLAGGEVVVGTGTTGPP